MWRGRRLAALGRGDAAAHLRPTTDRVRESIFNLLINGGYLEDLLGARVLDVFAGTGALGLEAVSRGAQAVTFIESGRTSLALLRENIALLDAPATVVARDARKAGIGVKHGLIFMDPPYGKGLGEAALPELGRTGWIAPGALCVWEDAVAPALPTDWNPLDKRRYGDTVVTLARYDGK